MKKILMMCVVGMMAGVAFGATSKPVVISSQMRASDPTVMDVVYKVVSDKPTVKVRALAFQDGERSFWKVVRATTFVEDPDGNPTAQNIGDDIEPNVEHKLAWKVSKDWKIDLAKVKFEVLCSDQAQLPLKLNHIKAVGKYPALTIGVGTQTDADIFNALLWHYADGAKDIINTDGYLDLDHPYPNQVDKTNIRIVKRTTIANRMEALRYIYEKMGWEPLEGGNLLNYARQATRKDLWFNSKTQTAVVLKSSKPEQLYVGEKTYCVIDVSGGPDAESYPVAYLDYEPTAGWSDEYKTTKIVLRRCESGHFNMDTGYGHSSSWRPVTLTRGFYIGVFTVTQRQYELVMGSNPSVNKGRLRPVEVSWNAIRGLSSVYDWPKIRGIDSESFVGRLVSKTGISFDLPTQAEFEYACRAGTTSQYFNGGDSGYDLMVLAHTESDIAVDVGLYHANLWGLFDMTGNIGQWCLDKNVALTTDPVVDPEGDVDGSQRVIRGYYRDYNPIFRANSSCRVLNNPSYNRHVMYEHMGGLAYVGFRLLTHISK